MAPPMSSQISTNASTTLSTSNATQSNTGATSNPLLSQLNTQPPLAGITFTTSGSIPSVIPPHSMHNPMHAARAFEQTESRPFNEQQSFPSRHPANYAGAAAAPVPLSVSLKDLSSVLNTRADFNPPTPMRFTGIPQITFSPRASSSGMRRSLPNSPRGMRPRGRTPRSDSAQPSLQNYFGRPG